MIRLFDIIFSLCAVIILSPLLLFTMIILKCSGEYEIFYLQNRIGKHGDQFKLIKFVTMLKNSPNIGSKTITLKNDPRVLPIGKFLRKTKINELPQLFNVLSGQMSLIGPRPLTDETFSAYSTNIQDMIIQVKPGLSGIGSIIMRGEEDLMSNTKASIDFYKNTIAPYKGALEEWFISNKSLHLYFTAIFVTFLVVLRPKSSIAWRYFKGLPEPPNNLKKELNFIKNTEIMTD